MRVYAHYMGNNPYNEAKWAGERDGFGARFPQAYSHVSAGYIARTHLTPQAHELREELPQMTFVPIGHDAPRRLLRDRY